ncbi:MAG: 50S ribosomal protein L22 [SAR202 cluster bacterium]|mgnify:FL=1|nr:50S ribosomal protein L22 [SAR202 cluster bacterium]|tara:strand:+ start:1795 stop:2133 length:339 start_codon:yes stop_codon:yes gene_type:complete
MSIRAQSKNTGISVKKLKPIVNLVRGMNVNEALVQLQFMQSPAAEKVAKTVKSAVSNAENELMVRSEDLIVSEIFANEGPRLKRFRAEARGRAGRIQKRSSHITVVVAEESI